MALDFWKRFMRRIDAGWFRDDGDELCSFRFSRVVFVKWLSIRDRGHDVGLLSILADSLRKWRNKWPTLSKIMISAFFLPSKQQKNVFDFKTYSMAFRYRQKKSGRIRYLYNSNSHSFSRSASLFDIRLAFGMLNGPRGSPLNSGMLLKKSQVCWKLSGVPARGWSRSDCFVQLPNWMPKNPLTFEVGAFRVAAVDFLPFVSNRGNPTKCGNFGQKFASLRIRLSAINGAVVKVFSPWYCS